jgi:CMP-N,N'-diacetyllegionaminic acid synthase
MKIYSIIPARGGSKGVPKKNIILLGGYPLIAYSIVASKLSSSVERTIVSTDSEEIADIARQYGAEVPFMRPAQFAGDKSTDAEVFVHAVQWFEHHEGKAPDAMVQLRPTTPLRSPEQIDQAVTVLQQNPKATGLRSAHEFPEPPHKMFQLTAEGYFDGFFPDDPRPEYYNLPRQMLPKAYYPNGYVDIIKTDLFIKNNSLYGGKILGFVTPFSIEVDTTDDIERLNFELSHKGSLLLDYLRKNYPRT